MQGEPRDREQALADLIERRKNGVLTRHQRELIERMIVDLEAEIRLRPRLSMSPPTER
jgi:hypothetical protein